MLYAKTIPKTIVCPTCKGEGTVKVGNLREMHNHDTDTCPDCWGKRVMRRIVKIEYQKI